MTTKQTPTLPGYSLTPRERDVLRALVEGKTNKEIAAALTLAISTVHNHMQSIITKLGTHSRTQAAVKAMREKILSRCPACGRPIEESAQ